MAKAIFGYSRLSERLGKHHLTLRNQFSKCPWKLPPAIIMPGANGPKWTDEIVDKWLAEHIVEAVPPQVATPERQIRVGHAGRGRPRVYPRQSGAE